MAIIVVGMLWSETDVRNKFDCWVSTLRWSKALWLDSASQVTSFSQSEGGRCFIADCFIETSGSGSVISKYSDKLKHLSTNKL